MIVDQPASIGALPLAAFDLASRPPVPSASTNPACHRSRVSLHFPVAGSCSQRGRPRRVSSMPSTRTSGSGASITSRAEARKASFTVCQDRCRSRAAWMTVGAASRIRRPAAPRCRMVICASAGGCGICSVKDRRGQPGSRHHQRRLCRRNSSPLSPYGRSRAGWSRSPSPGWRRLRRPGRPRPSHRR